MLEEEVKWFPCKRCFTKLKVSWNKLELNLFKLSCVRCYPNPSKRPSLLQLIHIFKQGGLGSPLLRIRAKVNSFPNSYLFSGRGVTIQLVHVYLSDFSIAFSVRGLFPIHKTRRRQIEKMQFYYCKVLYTSPHPENGDTHPIQCRPL